MLEAFCNALTPENFHFLLCQNKLIWEKSLPDYMLNELHNLEVSEKKHNIFLISENISSVLNFSVMHQIFQKSEHTSAIPQSLQGPGKREAWVRTTQRWGRSFFCRPCLLPTGILQHFAPRIVFQGEGLSVHQYRPFLAWVFQVGLCCECSSHQL